MEQTGLIQQQDFQSHNSMKICNKCKVEKDNTKFSKDASQKDGLSWMCKDCRNKNSAKHYKSNQPTLVQKRKEYYQKSKITKPEQWRQYQQKSYWKNPKLHRERSRAAKLLKQYGMTEEQHNFLLSSQGGKCPLCLCEITNLNIATDHDHTTGKVRAILCKNCNSGLGLFYENTTVLERAIQYLKFHATDK